MQLQAGPPFGPPIFVAGIRAGRAQRHPADLAWGAFDGVRGKAIASGDYSRYKLRPTVISGNPSPGAGHPSLFVAPLLLVTPVLAASRIAQPLLLLLVLLANFHRPSLPELGVFLSEFLVLLPHVGPFLVADAKPAMSAAICLVVVVRYPVLVHFLSCEGRPSPL
ncbi:hypothetical protein BDP81DRAFT_394270 [Colletotrichum phormii]|uniref:Uncharacterized protein n=1 Tax=Colletotrichum phormii TaxID=359342 RepID=A0AAI9ZR05_9PEZI|nr:uncharacterized protein BDP81DRAFT_394270 [Colletotrichum phormii]KAK1636605.1 hypothetical protein BDP81DRAFT_394270 [Colletotrichum phormii]